MDSHQDPFNTFTAGNANLDRIKHRSSICDPAGRFGLLAGLR
jgi:hypothetical protein